ncbi:MAG: DUF3822 family protein [Flavobacteriales bacterium]
MSVEATHDIQEYFDLTFSNESASHYMLLLELDHDMLRACWYHQTKNLITGFAAYPVSNASLERAFQQLFAEHTFLKSEFDQCVVSVRTSNYALIPKSSEKQSSKRWFELSNNMDESNEVLLEYSLVGERIKVLFALDNSIEKVIKSCFINSKVIPHIAPRIEHQLGVLKSLHLKDCLIAHISTDQVDIQAYQDSDLQLANSFFQSGHEDIAYYILYTSEVLGINPETTPLTVSGNISIGDDSWKMLSDYWKKMEVAKPMDRIQISSQLDGYPTSEFDYLTQSLLCAS